MCVCVCSNCKIHLANQKSSIIGDDLAPSIVNFPSPPFPMSFSNFIWITFQFFTLTLCSLKDHLLGLMDCHCLKRFYLTNKTRLDTSLDSVVMLLTQMIQSDVVDMKVPEAKSVPRSVMPSYTPTPPQRYPPISY